MAAPASMKRLAIDKANTQMIVILSVAAFISVFCLVASKAVLSQNAYNAKVISAKEKANKQLEDNIKAADTLVNHYEAFVDTSTNAIGGNKSGTGDNDGDNAKIILDALPSAYDFPALTSSLEKITSDRKLNVSSITGTDDQVNQQGNATSTKPQAVPMPFELTINDASYQGVQSLIDAFEHSIRPIQIDKLEISGGGTKMQAVVTAHTYYQPGISLNIKKEVVK